MKDQPQPKDAARREALRLKMTRRPLGASGGIARAFLTDPRILILDDSTSAIDSATEDQIQRAMRRISRDRTTFLITHRISQIRWADRILVLRRGELFLLRTGTAPANMAGDGPPRRGPPGA